MSIEKRASLKRENDLLLVESKKQLDDFIHHLLKWANFARFDAFDLEKVEKMFHPFACKLETANDMLEKNTLRTDFKEFETYFLATYACQEDFETFLHLFTGLNELRKEEGNLEEKIRSDNLFELADAIYFNKIQSYVCTYYATMQKIFDNLAAYADELYVHYTGDTTFGGTMTPLN